MCILINHHHHYYYCNLKVLGAPSLKVLMYSPPPSPLLVTVLFRTKILTWFAVCKERNRTLPKLRRRIRIGHQ